jgi:type IV pilus assembly protein PilM
MARTNAAWGIDIGQCALKALRCRPHDDPAKVVVDAFDYIEYPKILTQPDAEPAALVAEALKQFLSRNVIRGDRVAVSVPGQSGLARFIKLPPVEARKIPDIVRYEARQQIPFDLNDVIWDFQRMGGSSEEEGFILETEIGLFAMKRDAVFRALAPFRDAGIEIDLVQLAPLSIYNYVSFDQLKDLPPADQYDPENPPESVVVISLGTDATDLVVTNGFRVWQRSIPLGGSHFTKALTKELKLTFAKAEHLKRNATTAQDPKAVFQAMRPIFNDLQVELQRSLSYFTNLDRYAKLGRVIALGNAFKLPGLRRYLSQSLGFEIQRVDSFHGMVGPEVAATPAFKENILSFGVSYGLGLQALSKGGLRTNLLPKEIVTARLIRDKKPWAVAAAAVLLLGCAVSYAAYALSVGAVRDSTWKPAENQASVASNHSSTLKTEAKTVEQDFKRTKATGDHLISNIEGRTRLLDLLQIVNQCLPQYGAKQQPPAFEQRDQLNVENFECQQVEDLAPWFAGVKARGWYEGPGGAAAKNGDTQPATEDASGGAAPPAASGGEPGPTGPGYIVQVKGYHYHNLGTPQGGEYVRTTLIKNLLSAKINLPGRTNAAIKELGISYPVLIDPKKIFNESIKRSSPSGPKAPADELPPPRLGETAAAKQEEKIIKRFDFTVQFAWKPTSPGPPVDKSKEAAAEPLAGVKP